MADERDLTPTSDPAAAPEPGLEPATPDVDDHSTKPIGEQPVESDEPTPVGATDAQPGGPEPLEPGDSAAPAADAAQPGEPPRPANPAEVDALAGDGPAPGADGEPSDAAPASDVAQAAAGQATTKLDQFTRRSDDDVLPGGWCRIVNGEHAGKYGFYDTTASADDDGYPVLVNVKLRSGGILTVNHADIRPAELDGR
jgi:hypothetical protein